MLSYLSSLLKKISVYLFNAFQKLDYHLRTFGESLDHPDEPSDRTGKPSDYAGDPYDFESGLSDRTGEPSD